MTQEILSPDMEKVAVLKAQLEKIKKDRAELAVKNTPTELELLQQEMDREALELENDKVIEDLQTKYGKLGKKIARIDTEEGMIVVKCPSQPDYQKFVDKASEEKTITNQMHDNLVISCLLHPSKNQFRNIVNLQPAVLINCCDVVCTLAGVKDNSKKKK